MWYLELPAAVKQFDYDSISDVILHVKYPARDGGQALRANATASLNTRINQMLVDANNKGLMCLINAKNDLPDAWYQFLNTVNTSGDQVLTLNLDKTWFPFFVQDKAITINGVDLIAGPVITPVTGSKLSLSLSAPLSTQPNVLTLTATGYYGQNFLSGSVSYNSSPLPSLGIWTVNNPKGNAPLTAAQLNNLMIIVHYTVS